MIIEIKVPSPGESITEVEIGSWLVENGAVVEMDDELVEINSDKATLTVAAEDDGKIEILAQDGDVVRVGDVIAKIDTSAAGAKKEEAPAKDEKSSSEPAVEKAAPSAGGGYAEGHPSASADKLMKSEGLSKEQVSGSGRGGRITKGDVVEAAKNKSAAPATGDNGKSSAAAAAPVSAPGERGVTRKRMSLLRRKIADRLVSAKNDTAMLTTFNEVDMYAIMELRKKYKERFKEEHGIGLGFMGFFTKAVCEAMKHFPAINAYLDGDEMVFHDYVDVGVAVSTPRGLVVPNIRNAETLSLWEIESAIRQLALKARDNKITIEDMTGGTFTITNGGVFGSMLSTPILNPPQSAILGMHNIVQRPWVVDGEIKIRPIMYVALSYDHRIVDGKESVSFLYKVKEMLEDPTRLLLGF